MRATRFTVHLPKPRNPVARLLSEARFRSTEVRPRKGAGSYVRKGRNNRTDEGRGSAPSDSWVPLSLPIESCAA